MTDGVSLADIAAVTDNKDGMFGGKRDTWSFIRTGQKD